MRNKARRTAADMAGRVRSAPVPRFVQEAAMDNPESRFYTAAGRYAKGGTVKKKTDMRGSMARDKKVLRNLDDEIYRIAPKTYAKGAEGRNARDEYGRINREKSYEKNQMNRMAKGGSVKKSAAKKGTVQSRGCGLAKRGCGPTKLY